MPKQKIKGILFASCSGAFLYSKINRIQFRAPVTFSRIMCLQYGEGLLDSDITSALGAYLKTSMKSNDNYLQEEDDDSLSLHHFPFIEFRIVHNVSIFITYLFFCILYISYFSFSHLLRRIVINVRGQ